ncbi:YgjV family protein [Alginatibacterium sediminis]|uniref:YgjV family protein n=1 Tax=Alginatibacterium sediminis TaxID=2164068 RepID=A0A420E738_9ALTE|nr:YgjV family protein [Alginatibacterium sediminis]RKF14274.1 YgjV family protein [Alginatibacterium sediminis]
MDVWGFNQYTVAQVLGFIAFFFSIAAFATTKDKRFRVFLTVACLLLALQYGLLFAYVAAANLVINAFRALWSINHSGHKWFWAFFITQSIISVIVYKSPIDLLPWFASAISCYALFFLSGIQLRIAMLLCTVVWLINSSLVGSYGAIFNDVFNITVTLSTIYRLKLAKSNNAASSSP